MKVLVSILILVNIFLSIKVVTLENKLNDPKFVDMVGDEYIKRKEVKLINEHRDRFLKAYLDMGLLLPENAFEPKTFRELFTPLVKMLDDMSGPSDVNIDEILNASEKTTP